MARFIVVPKFHGRVTTYEIIDTDANTQYRFRLGHLDDENAAKAVTAVLNEHRAAYTAALAKADQAEAF